MKDFGNELFTGYEDTLDKKGMTVVGSTKSYKPCYEKHPVLKLGKGTFIGGSCSCPMTDDADVYIGLDYSMHTHGSWPWQPQPKKKAIDVSYPITDYQAPKDAGSFKDMVNWVCNQLQKGKTIHAGCIGGHGRTGTLLSAVVAEMERRKTMDLGNHAGNAIGWVRKFYCKKAVESEAQIKFLHKHFGCKIVEAAKPISYGAGGYTSGGYSGKYSGGSYTSGSASDKSRDGYSVSSVPGNRCIWEVFVQKPLQKTG